MTAFKSPHRIFGPASFYKRALALSLPVMGQLLIQNLVSLVDNFMVAGLGDIKMSGVNICGQVNFVFWELLIVIVSAGGIFMSQYNGAKDKEGMQQSFKFKLIVSGIVTLAYFALSLYAPHWLLGFMVHGNAASEQIISAGQVYMRYMAASWIFACVSNVIASSLRETGREKSPLIISSIATGINTFCNWIFIYGNLGAPRLELRGAAIATNIARFTEMIIYIAFLYKTKPEFFTPVKKLFSIKPKLFGNIFKKACMLGASEMTWCLTETFVTALYNSRGGAETVSGMASGYVIANLFFVAFSAIFTSTGVILGGTLGEGKMDEARQQKNWIISGGTIFGAMFGFVGAFTVFLIPLVFGSLTPQAQNIAKGVILFNAAYMVVWGFINSEYAISRTGGDTTLGIVADGIGNIFYLAGMFLLVKFTLLGPVAMMAIMKSTDAIKITIATLWLKKERWLVNLTTMEKE